MFASRGICHSIADFLCDGELGNTRQTCKLAHASFEGAPINLENVKTESVPKTQQHLVRRTSLIKSPGMDRISRPIRLHVCDEVLNEQLCFIPEFNRHLLEHLLIENQRHTGKVFHLNEQSTAILSQCHNLSDIYLHGTINGGQLLGVLFRAGTRLRKLSLCEDTFYSFSCELDPVKIHPERLTHLTINRHVRLHKLEASSPLVNLTTLFFNSTCKVDSSCFESLLGDCKSLRNLRLSRGNESGIVQYLERLPLTLDCLDVRYMWYYEWDLSKWTVSKCLVLVHIVVRKMAKLLSCCSAEIPVIAIWQDEEYANQQRDAENKAAFKRLGAVRYISSNAGFIFEAFSDCKSVSHVNISQRENMTDDNIFPPSARHLRVYPSRDDDNDAYIKRRESTGRWESVKLTRPGRAYLDRPFLDLELEPFGDDYWCIQMD